MSKNVVEPERPQKAIRWLVACWISNATLEQAHAPAHAPTHTPTRARTHTHPHPRIRTQLKYADLLLLHDNNSFVNAPECYVIRALPFSLCTHFARSRSHGRLSTFKPLADVSIFCRVLVWTVASLRPTDDQTRPYNAWTAAGEAKYCTALPFSRWLSDRALQQTGITRIITSAEEYWL